MILRGDEAFLRPYHADRLVMATVSVFQFVDGGASGFCQQLVTHADTADRFVSGERFADILNGRIAGIRVAGTVADEQAVVFQRIEIVIPGHADNRYITFQQAADDVMFHAAIYQDNAFLTFAFAVSNHFLTGHFIYIIHIRVFSEIGCFNFFPANHDLSHHHAMFAQFLGQGTCIDPINSGNTFFFQPASQTLYSIPMTILMTVIAYDDGIGMYLFTLHESGNSIRPKRTGGYTVISYQRIS